MEEREQIVQITTRVGYVLDVDLKIMRIGETVTGAAKREIINQVEGGQLSMVSSQEAVSYTHLDVYKRQGYKEQG